MFYVRFSDGDILLTKNELFANNVFDRGSAVSFGKVVSDICFEELKGNFVDTLEEFDLDGCPVEKEVSDVKQTEDDSEES